METIFILTFILLLAELFEAYIQRSETLLGVLKKLYIYYNKSIFLFFLVQPGFYVILFIVLLTEILNISMVFLLALKIFDIFYKIELIKKVFIEQNISEEIAQMLTWKIPPWFFLMGVGMYPPLLFYALM
ncbi:MAG TPA: hypothetical protein EYH42_07210 [Sulfurovum sp.]|nr:hypothetical protein [Sulfurovum sp.]